MKWKCEVGLHPDGFAIVAFRIVLPSVDMPSVMHADAGHKVIISHIAYTGGTKRKIA